MSNRKETEKIVNFVAFIEMILLIYIGKTILNTQVLTDLLDAENLAHLTQSDFLSEISI